MKRVVLCIAVAACTKESAERGARLSDSMVSLESHGPVRTTPRRLFDDFTRPDADGLALLDKYAGGATFTATIRTVGREEDGTPVVWIDVDGENVIAPGR